MDVPPLCVIEAKKEDWDEGWAPALAEMYAASIQGATVCYAVVTSGEQWHKVSLRKKRPYLQRIKENDMRLTTQRNLITCKECLIH